MSESQPSPLAIGSLLCGILGCGCCPCFGYPIAIVFGSIEIKRINAGESDDAGRTLAKTGIILGVAGTIVYGLAFMTYGVLVAMGKA